MKTCSNNWVWLSRIRYLFTSWHKIWINVIHLIVINTIHKINYAVRAFLCGTCVNLQGSTWCLGNLKLLTMIQHIPFYKLLHELNICTYTHMKKDCISLSITCWNLTGLILVCLHERLKSWSCVILSPCVARYFYCYWCLCQVALTAKNSMSLWGNP